MMHEFMRGGRDSAGPGDPDSRMTEGYIGTLDAAHRRSIVRTRSD